MYDELESRALQYEAVLVHSPCQAEGEKKNQDRSLWNSEFLLACVCDGVTSSPFAEEAAELVCESMGQILKLPTANISEELWKVRDRLLELRSACSQRPVKFSDEVPAALRTTLTEVAQERRSTAYQSTVAAMRIIPQARKLALLRMVWCGDTGLFAFAQTGELIWSNLGQLCWRDARTVVTDALPDSVAHAVCQDFILSSRNENQPIGNDSLGEDTHFLLASDGFYSCFPEPREMWDWLVRNYKTLRQNPNHNPVLGALHQELYEKTGDDDMSLVFLVPFSSSVIKSE